MSANKKTPLLSHSRIVWGIMTFLAVGVAIFTSAPYWSFNPDISLIPLNPSFTFHMVVLSLHAIPGGLALLIGPFQFIPRIRTRYPHIHRLLGRVYVICIIIGSIMGFYSAIVSTAGFVAQLGFLVLATIWFYSVIQAFITIRRGQIQLHRIWMIRNYALTFAAVVLRVWLVLGITYMAITGNMPESTTSTDVYISAAWISWIAPLLIAEWFIIQRQLRTVALKADRVKEKTNDATKEIKEESTKITVQSTAQA